MMESEQKESRDDEVPLGFALGAAARKLAKFYVRALADFPLTPSQLFLVRQLWLEDGLSLSELSLRAQLDATSATWLVDQLEHVDLVERRRTDTDRRVVRLWLTASGRALQAELEPALAQWEAGLIERLLPSHSLEEIGMFRRVLVTLMTTFPEGDDLWEKLSASWDIHLDLLRTLIEATENKGE